MKRREFIALFGGAMGAALAQQPVIGILATASAEANAGRLRVSTRGYRR